MLYVVDRIENGLMFLENETEELFAVPCELIPGAREGDCVDININMEETEKRRDNVRRLMEELFQD